VGIKFRVGVIYELLLYLITAGNAVISLCN
jgi:hypothetical protein